MPSAPSEMRTSRPSAANRLDQSLRTNEVELLEFDRVIVRSVPAGSLEQVIFRVDALHRLEATGVRVLNPARAIEACVDKYLAIARLNAAGLDVPRTVVCEGAEDAMTAFDALGSRVVVKPLFGAEGRGIMLIDNGNWRIGRPGRSSSSSRSFSCRNTCRIPGTTFACFFLGQKFSPACGAGGLRGIFART